MTSPIPVEQDYDDQGVIDALIDEHGARELARDGSRWASLVRRGQQLGVTDRIIKECRLAGTKPAMRNCVSCDERFLSTGFHNRLCRRCRPR